MLCWKLICLVSFTVGWEGAAGIEAEVGAGREGGEVFTSRGVAGGELEEAVKPASPAGEGAPATCWVGHEVFHIFCVMAGGAPKSL